MKKLLSFLLVSCFITSFAQDKPAYILYNNDGKTVKYEKMIKSLLEADVVLFGELHNDPIAHWLQLEVTKSLHAGKKEKTVLGAEMFEADNQLIIDEYLSGLVSEKKFEAEARLWPNHNTDYKPLLSYAKENNLYFVATNIPRRYASIVFSKGQDGLKELSTEAKKFIAPLPFPYDSTLNCYKNMMGMPEMGGHVNQNFPMSQASKDATMAHFTLKNIKENGIFIHYNGAYHSDNHESIEWYLNNYKPGIKVVTISTVRQEDISTLSEESTNVANFIICVPENMTGTY